MEGQLQPKLQVTVTTWKANMKACRKSACQAKQAKHMSAVHQLKAWLVHFTEQKSNKLQIHQKRHDKFCFVGPEMLHNPKLGMHATIDKI